ncbi:outer membrane protein assembly factor BamA [Treponema sp. Marseille-Q3903]|uniref:outer membrane protein assembly factor BamA n=1 Tax=Treponema sp. Marseille-Q3903 TaxID=2766703 RepID=UPI001651CEBF|nr:outer membrane protein assembly factor BamA [Treponema sp. Marseille-Q3903]MBC6713419.1 outer membrane protein assembly factor BamA [Treponema sp. Marseille-Q3903]
MHRRFSVIFVILVSLFSVSAEEDVWYWNRPISKIEFNGLKNVKKSDLTGITSSFIDEPFTEDLYNDILDKLYSLDYFEDIVPYAKHNNIAKNDVLLVFEVTERPVIKSIEFRGNKKIRNGELREQIKAKTNDIFIESKILLDERIIRNYYLSKGYTNSTVSHEVESNDEGITVIFNINEGNSTVIKSIDFTGNSIVSAKALKGKLELKEIGLFRDGAYQPSTLEKDKLVILNYYRERGYADAGILDVKIESQENPEKQRDELSITFVIQEGPQYKYAGIKITGNKVFTDEELLNGQKLKEGAIFNETKFREDISAITSVYSQNGYMMNEYKPVPVKDTDRHEISYTLSITERSRSHIENIIIKDNNKTKEYVIRREIPITPGDVFSQSKIINGLRNLMNLRYFSNIVPDVIQGSEENLVNLIFSVEEQNTNMLVFGFAFSGTTDPGTIPISLQLKYENSNLLGEGRSFSVSTNISNTTQTAELNYGQNWIGDMPIALSSSLSLSHSTTTGLTNYWTPSLSLVQNKYYMTYQNWNLQLGTGVSRRWTPDYAILTVASGISNSLTNNIYDQALNVPVDSGISMYANRWGVSNSIYASFSVDNRDYNYYPSRGWFGSERLTWYGLLPAVEKEFFLKSDTKLEGYLTLLNIPFTEKWGLKLILADIAQFTGLFPTASGISSSNKLYVDGMFNGRGWTDIAKSTRGQALLSNKLELRMPVVPGIIGVDGFFDMIAVKPTVSEMSKLGLPDFYFSFGPGIRFLLPQLPLNLLFSWKFRYDNGAFKFEDDPFQFVLSFNIVNY